MLKNDAKRRRGRGRGADLCFKKRYQQVGKFWPNTQKSQILHVNAFVLTKAYTNWAKKEYRGVMHHYIEYRCKLWMKWGIWWTSPEHSNILK